MYEQGISKTTNNTIQIWFSEIVEQVPEVHEGYLENIGKQGKLGIKIERERILQRYDVLNFIPLDYQIYFHANTALWFSATIFSRNILDKIPFREHLHTGEDTLTPLLIWFFLFVLLLVCQSSHKILLIRPSAEIPFEKIPF